MLETLIALTLISIVGAAAVTLLRPPSPRIQLEVATRGLCATLRAARSSAIASGIPAAVAFNLDQRTYVSPVAGMTSLPKDMTVRLNVGREEVHARTAGIRFFPNEEASGGDIFLELGGRRSVISVNWMTGGVSCSLD